MFRTRGSYFRQTIVYTGMLYNILVYNVLHAKNIRVYTTVFPKMDPSVSKHVEDTQN
jgi:hypothetical protein